MKRILLAILVAGAVTAPAAAQPGGGVPNCDGDYRQFISKVPTGGLSGPQLARLNRLALRAYDGCTSGDERFRSDDFFKRLQTLNPAKADEFLKDIETNYPPRK